MSVTFNLKGADWAADKQKAASGDEAEYWSKLELNAKKTEKSNRNSARLFTRAYFLCLL